jgi:hypothetical protein
MAKKAHIRLEQIRIASPCPTSWDQMLGDDQIRFCNICSKNVYNLSAMTRADAERLINETNKKMCGLIYTRKDGTVMTSDCPVGLRAIRKRMIKRIASVAAMLAALVGGARFAIHQYNRPPELPNPIIQNAAQSDPDTITVTAGLMVIDH